MRLTLPHHAEAGPSPLELDSSRRAGVKPAELEHAITQRTVVFAGEATSKPLEQQKQALEDASAGQRRAGSQHLSQNWS